MKKEATYEIAVQCSNCDKSGSASIPRGTPVPGAIECPHCGCKTASKSKPIASAKFAEMARERTWPPQPMIPNRPFLEGIWTN